MPPAEREHASLPALETGEPLHIETALRSAPAVRTRLRRSWTVRCGGLGLAALGLVALAAPWLGTVDPTLFDPSSRDLLPGAAGAIMTLDGETLEHTFWMGSDSYGRDLYSRVLYATRVSLVVGIAVALVALAFGVAAGLVAGYVRQLDGPLMRVMDGLMAIPGILIAIALVALWRASLLTVVVAIAIPEIPRVTRLVRSLVLSIREEPFVEAAVALGTPSWKIMLRHILPNTVAPLIVQGTYICASAILVEAILSFLGVGLPTDIPTWGNIMAEGRVQFNDYPHNVFFPGVFLAVTVLAVNMLGDGLRDALDPRMSRRL
jgi:peptide/nickel transport system permease protein